MFSRKYLFIVLILVVVIIGGILVWQSQKTQKESGSQGEISSKEICQKEGGDLCAENEVCLTQTFNSGGISCCSDNWRCKNNTCCVTPKKATTKDMVLIPASTFTMGREDREGWSPMAGPQQFNDELPPHELYVDAFYIDKYEVANRQFKEFIDATGYITDAEDQNGSPVMVPASQAETPILGTDIGWKWIEGANWRAPEGPGSSVDNLMDYPVVHVSWNDANSYAKWSGKRLPTEAEWEKAARGGTQTNWFWGDEAPTLGQYVNYYGEHRQDLIVPIEERDGYDKTAPVGSLKPNQFGLYDTAGNVFEWVSDWYQYDYFQNSPRDNPQGPATGTDKVIKGGSWYFCECYLRPANRQPTEIAGHDHGLGFRLALDVE